MFKKINDGQVAVYYADYNTGIILDVNFKYHTDNTQIACEVFENIIDAKNIGRTITNVPIKALAQKSKPRKLDVGKK